MPFINSKVTVALSKENKETLKTEYAKIIAEITGKPEQWLMVGFEDNCDLYFAGTNDKPAAYLEFKLLGTLTGEKAEKLTAAFCSLVEAELKIPSDRIYVKYEEVEKWGWNKVNF